MAIQKRNRTVKPPGSVFIEREYSSISAQPPCGALGAEKWCNPNERKT
jgi:hypothetical protein